MSMTPAKHFHRKQEENRPKRNSYMQLLNSQATKPGISFTWQQEILVTEKAGRGKFSGGVVYP